MHDFPIQNVYLDESCYISLQRMNSLQVVRIDEYLNLACNIGYWKELAILEVFYHFYRLEALLTSYYNRDIHQHYLHRHLIHYPDLCHRWDPDNTLKNIGPQFHLLQFLLFH